MLSVKKGKQLSVMKILINGLCQTIFNPIAYETREHHHRCLGGDCPRRMREGDLYL